MNIHLFTKICLAVGVALFLVRDTTDLATGMLFLIYLAAAYMVGHSDATISNFKFFHSQIDKLKTELQQLIKE